MPDPILFSGGIASNFYRHAPFNLHVMLAGKMRELRMKSSEHGFHFIKALAFGYEFNAMSIYETSTPADAKRAGHAFDLSTELQRVWDEQLALPAMLRVNLAKFSQNPPCRAWLLQTGNAHLVEDRDDPIWGRGPDGHGKNQLGVVLEVVRALVR